VPELQARLWPYLGGIARENRMKALVVGGVENHVHVLLSIPSTLSVAKAVQLLKGNSSKWIHKTFKEHWNFEWQEGYGAFSIGVSGVEDTSSRSLAASKAILYRPWWDSVLFSRTTHR
jgi:putative transposase